MGLSIVGASGCELFDADGKRYLDCISGIAVANVGHNHPAVVRAIQKQAEKFSHVMVYGEFVLEPQVRFAEELAACLPGDLSVTFFANSGAEAIEGAVKTAKKFTGRSGIISFHGSYHGDTMGALSLMGSEEYRKPFLPLLPGVSRYPFNAPDVFDAISESTAAVIVEPIQGEAGVRIGEKDFLLKLRSQCTKKGALLIFDEVQSAFGRTGRMFACEHSGVVPDLLVMAKAMGGGLPLGGFSGPPEIMDVLSHDPPFSHVTTMGGNPVSCAAGLASLRVIREEKLCERAADRGMRLRNAIRDLIPDKTTADVRGAGLMMAIEFRSPELAELCVKEALKSGLIVGGMLLAPGCVRIAPPLILSDSQCDEIIEILGNIIPALF